MTVLDDKRQDIALETPAVKWKEAFLDAAREYKGAGEELDPAFPAYWSAPFEMYIRQLENMAAGRHLPMTTVQASTFWLFNGAGRFLAMSRLRHRLTPALEIEGGHIGYSVRPSERCKGYGSTLCAMTLDKAREAGSFQRVLITCDTDNRPSARIIEKNGGAFESYAVSPRSGKQVSRYWVDLERS